VCQDFLLPHGGRKRRHNYAINPAIKDIFIDLPELIPLLFYSPSSLSAYSTAALLAIVFAIPFGIRMLVHKDRGQWEEFGPAFYTAHLELYLGNGCLGESRLGCRICNRESFHRAKLWLS